MSVNSSIMQSSTALASIQPAAPPCAEPSVGSGRERSARFHSALKEFPVWPGEADKPPDATCVARSAGMWGKERGFWEPEKCQAQVGCREGFLEEVRPGLHLERCAGTKQPECGREGRAHGRSLQGARLDKDVSVAATSSELWKRQSHSTLPPLTSTKWKW